MAKSTVPGIVSPSGNRRSSCVTLDAPNARELQELRKTSPAQADKVQADGRAAAAAYAKDYALFDAEVIAAVDAFRKDKKLDYAGNPPGLVDERLVKTLRAAYAEKRRTGGK